MKKILTIIVCGMAYTQSMNAQMLVTTLAGQTATGSVNGTGSAASFNLPSGVCLDPSGNAYVTDRVNHLIRKITPAGVVTTFAGTGAPGAANGTGTLASFWYPRGLCSDLSGNIYVADDYNLLIRKITPAGVVTTFAGSGSPGAVDGLAASASFNGPIGVCSNAAGDIFVAEEGNQRVRMISSGTVSTIAGSGAIGFANATGTLASFNYLGGICIDPSGNIFVADQNNHSIRKITSAGVVTTFAGTGTSGSVDGTGTAASFNSPTGVSSDASGNIYVADFSNSRIRKIDPSGVVTTLSGFNGSGYLDGNTSLAKFDHPIGISTFTGNTLYVVDRANNRIRVISPCSAPNVPGASSPTQISVCIGQSGTLSASGTGTISWFTTSTGGTAIATGGTFVTTVTPTAVSNYTLYAEAASDCTVSTSRTAFIVNLAICESISEIKAPVLVKHIYPNPGNGNFTLELFTNSEKEITVMDITGKVILTELSRNTQVSIDLSTYSDGLYFVKITSSGKSETMKLIKR